MSKKIYSKEFAGKTLIVETGELAKQAGGSVLVRLNDSVVLSCATASKVKKDTDFFPLTVVFEEKLYAIGKIPGSFLRREGRPSEMATLSARLIDRAIRPLFAEGFRNEVQVVNTVLSADPTASVEMAALFGSSLALSISDIPFEGPVAGVIVGRINDQFVINPTAQEMTESTLDLAVAGTKEAINMVEAGAKELDEEVMLQAIMFGHEAIKKLIALQEEIAREVAKEKREIELYQIDENIAREVSSLAKARLIEAIGIVEKLKRYSAIDEINEEIIALFEAREYSDEKSKKSVITQVKDVLHDILKEEVRRQITVDKIRPDGRKIDEIRPLNSQVDLLPRTHGSALFTRGETQVLSICTLGALGDQQILDNLDGEDLKRFMHHYNFPPYSVGETGRMGSPGRREIGHGALGERALLQVIPSVEDFPYTIRVVSEVLESNGSSSQGSICASTMALMAAGVPLIRPVAGIAMGLVTNGPIESSPYTILSDIQGMEDHLGDMDFKVAGTEKGIVALQMDIKIAGINEKILREALLQAKVGRAHILQNMLATIDHHREDVSKYAPKVETLQIPIDKIRDVIGPGGKMINEIIAKADNVKIDIEQTGLVTIYHTDREAINTAVKMISNLTREAKVGDIYTGKVVRIESFGVFVNLFGDVDGLVRNEKLAHEKIYNPRGHFKIGETMTVIVTEIDEKGRINLSRKDLLPPPLKEKTQD